MGYPMSGGRNRRTSRCSRLGMTGLLGVAACVAVAIGAPLVSAAPRGAVNTTDDPGWSGPALTTDSGVLLGSPPTNACLNGIPGHTTPAVNCNIYQAPGDVFFSGSPKTAALGAGTYFFVVLAPGSQRNPNDPTSASPNPGNLSANPPASNPVTDREFSVDASGNVTPLRSLQAFDSRFDVIQVAPYDQTPNAGDTYILATCRISDTPGDYQRLVPTVAPNDCKYDAFKLETFTQLTRCVVLCGCAYDCARDTGSGAGSRTTPSARPEGRRERRHARRDRRGRTASSHRGRRSGRLRA